MAAELYFWGKTHSDILSQFINAMNCAELKYFILRNYEGLPEQNTSKDVDVVIEPGTYSVAKNLLLSSFRDNMISDYYIMDFERAHCIFGMSVDAGFAIHIDLIEGYANKGFEILSFAQLYDKTIRYKDFRVLEPAMDAVMLILYKVIGCKELKQKYRDKISDTYKEYVQIYTQDEYPFRGILVISRFQSSRFEDFKEDEKGSYEYLIKGPKAYDWEHPVEVMYLPVGGFCDAESSEGVLKNIGTEVWYATSETNMIDGNENNQRKKIIWVKYAGSSSENSQAMFLSDLSRLGAAVHVRCVRDLYNTGNR